MHERKIFNDVEMNDGINLLINQIKAFTVND